MKNWIYILGFALLVTGCHKRERALVKRSLLNAHGKIVYTVFANRADKTMSIVYIDKMHPLRGAEAEPKFVSGAVLEVVTYAQNDNKYWYGSYLNGPLRSVEQLTLKKLDSFPRIGVTAKKARDPSLDPDNWQYSLIEGDSPATGHPHPGRRQIYERTRQIISKSAVFFP